MFHGIIHLSSEATKSHLHGRLLLLVVVLVVFWFHSQWLIHAFNGVFNETLVLSRQDQTGGSRLTLIVPDSFRTMQLQGIPLLSGPRLCVDVHHIYCDCNFHSLSARVRKHARQNIWKNIHRCPRMRPAGTFHILFTILYDLDWSKIIQFVSGGIFFSKA